MGTGEYNSGQINIDMLQDNCQGEDQKNMFKSNFPSPNSSLSCSPPPIFDPNRWYSLPIDVKHALQTTGRMDDMSPTSSVSTCMNNFKSHILPSDLHQQTKISMPSPRTNVTEAYDCVPSPSGSTIRSPFVYKRKSNHLDYRPYLSDATFQPGEESFYPKNQPRNQYSSTQSFVRGAELYPDSFMSLAKRSPICVTNTVKRIQYHYDGKQEVANSHVSYIVQHNGKYCQYCSENAVNHTLRRNVDSDENAETEFDGPSGDFQSKDGHLLNEVKIDIGNCTSSMEGEINDENMSEVEVRKDVTIKTRGAIVKRDDTIFAEQKGESGYSDDFEDDSRMDESIQSISTCSRTNQGIKNKKLEFLSHILPSSSIVEESESKQNSRIQLNHSSQNENFMERIFSSTYGTPLSSPKHPNSTMKPESKVDLDYPFCEEFILSTDSSEYQDKRRTYSSADETKRYSLLGADTSNTTTIFQSYSQNSNQGTFHSCQDLRPCDVMVSFNPDEDEEVLDLLIKVADSLNPDLFDEMVSYFGF